MCAATEWIMSSTIQTSRVSYRNTLLQNFYQLDSWRMFCPGWSFSMPWQPSYIIRFSFLIISSQQIYLYRASSGFEPESPVQIRTWTWNAGNKIDLEVRVNAHKTKYMVMSRDQNAGRSHNIKVENSSFERVEEFRYLGTPLTYQGRDRWRFL